MSEADSSAGRLGDVSTLWTLVLRAGGDEAATTARHVLCHRYHGPAVKFLRAAVGDDLTADELAQEFAVRVLRGDLGGAHPDRGRFRDFVKGVLRHLIADHYRRLGRAHEVLAGSHLPDLAGPAVDPAALDREWLSAWRQALLDRAWGALAEHQARTGQPVFEVLRFRADHPGLRSHEMAGPLGERLGRAVTADWVRQAIHRARERFGELLLAEVADTLSNPDADALTDELVDVELLQYCQAALDDWRAKRAQAQAGR